MGYMKNDFSDSRWNFALLTFMVALCKLGVFFMQELIPVCLKCGIFHQHVVEASCLTLTNSRQHFMWYMGLSPLMATRKPGFIMDQYGGKSKMSDIAYNMRFFFKSNFNRPFEMIYGLRRKIPLRSSIN
jgi:hypothetical protein